MIEDLDRDDRKSGVSQTIRAVGLVLAAKALVFLTVYLSLHLLPSIFNADRYQKSFHWPENEPASVAWMFKTWDGAHYLFLSEEGYADAGASAAFYPFWPAVIHLTAPVFGSSLLAALVLANLLSIAGLVILHRLTARLAGDRAADTTLLLTLAYPGAIYYCFPYSESLFLLITVSVFYLLSEGRLRAAAALSILAPMTRAVGIFLIIPLAWRIATDWRRGTRPLWQVMLAAAPVVGFALTLGVMWVQTDNALAGLEAQSFYASQGSVAKLLDPVAFVRTFVDVWGVHGVLHSGLDRVFFVLMLLGVWTTHRMERGRAGNSPGLSATPDDTRRPIDRATRPGEKRLFGPFTFYGAAMVLVPAMTMSFMAFIRYSSAAFPVFMGFGTALSGGSRREIRWLLMAFFLIIQVFFLIRHINSHWAA